MVMEHALEIEEPAYMGLLQIAVGVNVQEFEGVQVIARRTIEEALAQGSESSQWGLVCSARFAS
jgi:hypothetical protein